MSGNAQAPKAVTFPGQIHQTQVPMIGAACPAVLARGAASYNPCLRRSLNSNQQHSHMLSQQERSCHPPSPQSTLAKQWARLQGSTEGRAATVQWSAAVVWHPHAHAKCTCKSYGQLPWNKHIYAGQCREAQVNQHCCMQCLPTCATQARHPHCPLTEPRASTMGQMGTSAHFFHLVGQRLVPVQME